MTPFAFARAGNVPEAVRLGAQPQAKFLGGGTNLVDLMREMVEQPATLVDVTGLSNTIDEQADGSLLIGAGVRNTALAAHPAVRERYPMLSRAILAGASAQIRNMATVGGNILQRTRCAYFYDLDAARCNKRTPGAGCDAIHGLNRHHAVLGGSSACVATHPSDMCVALVALDAVVHLESSKGQRTLPLVELHRLPGDRPDLETAMAPGELITAIAVPRLPVARRSSYRKVRDRSSYAFALVSVAAALEIVDDVITDVRLALGGVGTTPWRAWQLEDMLRGQPVSDELLRTAAALEFTDARPLRDNGFKIDLAQRTIVAVLTGLARQQGDMA